MHPPSWILNKLYEVNPYARLGWAGAERNPDEPLNKGTFALVELRPSRAAGRSIIGVEWQHGPLFGRSFDPLRYVPFFIIPVSPQDVFNGKVLFDLKRWSTSFKQRALETRRKAGLEYEKSVTELAQEQGEYLYWKAQQTGSTSGVSVPRKHLTAEDRAILDGTYRERPEMDLTDKAEPANPRGGVLL